MIIPEGRDITQLKQAEVERIRAQLYSERLSIAMRVAKAGAWNWDLRAQQIFWTPEFESLFDYEPGSTQQIYSEWLDRLHPEDLDRVETSLQTASEGKLPEYRCEYRIVLRDGQIRWIDAVMDALIDGLLRYSRAGREELATETVDVAEVLAETIDSLSPPASFEIRIVNSMPILDTKRLLLTQVFANLINNAIKHHHRIDGFIEITVEDLGDRHRFSIADDVPGIPDGESRDRIFEIFQTLNPTTDSTENTGIGLALVKKIVEGEGGEIWLDDEYAQGCRFCFTWIKTEIRLRSEI